MPRPVAALALLALLAAAGALARPPVALESLTSPELAARIAAGATTVLVPIGGTEQNGPYMTLGKHNARVEALALRIADKLGNAIVAPVVAYVPEGRIEPPTAHMRFPGTITIPERAFESMLESTAASLRAAGFRDIVLLGDHGGYRASLEHVAATLNRAWSSTPARVHALPEYYRAASKGYDAMLAARGFSAAEIGVHAGLADTSLTLASVPSAVRLDQLHAASDAAHAAGVAGDPSRATAGLGTPGVDAIVAASVDAIQKAVARH